MKLLKKLTVALIFIFIITSDTSRVSSGVGFGLPIGGRVTMYNPACTVGFYVNIVTFVPGVGAGTWMYSPLGAMTYAYGPPLPGGQTLGMATGFAPCMTYCPTGICPVIGAPGGAHIYMIGTGIA